MRTMFLLFITISTAFARQTSYLPPVFTDSARAERVKATQPFVEKMFREHMEKQHMPGLAYGVVLDGKLLYAGGLGFSNLEKKYAADASSMFRIASMSKSFTALAILQLRDAGKLDLDDPASKEGKRANLVL